MTRKTKKAVERAQIRNVDHGCGKKNSYQTKHGQSSVERSTPTCTANMAPLPSLSRLPSCCRLDFGELLVLIPRTRLGDQPLPRLHHSLDPVCLLTEFLAFGSEPLFFLHGLNIGCITLSLLPKQELKGSLGYEHSVVVLIRNQSSNFERGAESTYSNSIHPGEAVEIIPTRQAERYRRSVMFHASLRFCAIHRFVVVVL
jgi:hypothetical protein